ncbi:MAG: membrane dipeptidase [Peptococcaceae bacterium]|nr:membrane dipeptidase [Peptococcaceae bacterium]
MIFDGHSDILYGINRWRQRGEMHVFQRRYLPWFQRSGIEGGIFVLWANPENGLPASVQIQQQIQALQSELQEGADNLLMLRTAEDLEEAVLLQKMYFILGAEGLDGYVQDATCIDWLYEQGVRHVGLTWNHANGFAGGVYSDNGLTEEGMRAVKNINQKKMLLDVSHLNDKSLRDALRIADGPVIASHSNSRRLCDVPRNLTDDQIKAIASTGGVVGINSHPPFVHTEKEKQNLEHLANHLIHMAELAGTEHIGFGFDLNYWDDSANAEGMEELKQYGQAVPFLHYLKQRGFSGPELRQISRDNFLRMMQYAVV